MTLASQGIGARLERGDPDSESVRTITRPNPYAVYDKSVIPQSVITLKLLDHELRGWPIPREGLMTHHLSLTMLGSRQPAASSPMPFMSFFPHKRLSGPVQVVLKLLDYWRLSKDDAVSLLGFDPADSDYVEDILNGMASFRGRDVRDRIAHLFYIWTTLSSLFQDRDVENDWLREPHALLDEESPLNLLLGGAMENLLLVKDYVDAAAGH